MTPTATASPDQSRLEYANDEGGMARDNFNAASITLPAPPAGLTS